MKKLKFFVVTLFITLISQVTFSQEKIEGKALELVAEMNSKLSESTKLTFEQEKLLIELYKDKIKEIRAVKKAVTNETEQKEKIKEINKTYSKKIHETVLTKEQKSALKEYRQKSKEQ